jgi:hypothetical protein
MWKSTVTLAILVSITSGAYAGPFSPNIMGLSAPDNINYDFTGTALSIPVILSGTPADVSFCVFTKNQGSKISMVTNGYLGWHYVNRIDTCLYVSPSNLMEIGANTINWDGKDENGAAVPPGDYSYYLFGYDYKTPRVKVTLAFNITGEGCGWTMLEQGEDGNPLARPIIHYARDAGTIGKWVIGNDPEDVNLLETTRTTGITEDKAGDLAILPTDQTKFFQDAMKSAGVKVTRKWTWIPSGNAVIDSTWGINGEYTYSGAWNLGNFGPGVVSDGQDRLFLSNANYYLGTESKLIILNAADGSEVKQLDLSQWWVNVDEGQAGGQNVSGPTEISFRNGLIALGAHGTCLNSVMDPYSETTDEAVLWVNRNGDYIGDHNWEPSSPRKWVCNDYNVGPYKYTTSMDSQGFVIFAAYGIGGMSIGLYAPDGTGISYKAYMGEKTGSNAYGNWFCDYGSPYDGIYTAKGVYGLWFVAHDSFKGLITNQTGVNVSAPAAFSVAQNTPNPFNPATTIRFTMAKTGKVSVDVFDVAGQKVATLVNGSLNAGSHSVVWNASKFSAGVYFYTVKEGGFSRTMRMTLLK